MGFGQLLGFGINYDRVNKKVLKERYQIMDFIIASILFADVNLGMDVVIEQEINSLIKIYNHQSKDNILGEFKRILKVMGVEAPTKNKYPEFERILWDTSLPSQRKLKQNPHWQENWNKAQQWLKEKETNKENSAYTKQLEQKLKDQEERIKKLEKQNSYEKD